jgi:DNA-binding IclR family transcriptional regulator
MKKDDSKVKSLAKSLRILECFRSNTPELGITQISEMLELNKSNVHSIVATFEKLGYLEKNPMTDKYRLGLKLLEYAYIINEHLGYQRAVYPTLNALAAQSGETTYFGIPKNNRVLYICNAYPPSMQSDYPYRSILGETAPFTCTALGKAMLAFMDANDVDIALSLPRERFTDTTIMDKAAILSALQDIRRSGLSQDRCEHEYGIHCISAPIFACSGVLVGAISISGPVQDFSCKRIAELERMIKEAAFRLRDRF